MKRRYFSVIGIILAIFGAIWFLQGANILLGSAMTGSPFWEVTGALTIVVGLAIIAYSLKS